LLRCSSFARDRILVRAAAHVANEGAVIDIRRLEKTADVAVGKLRWGVATR